MASFGRRKIFWTAAAALSTTLSANAFVIQRPLLTSSSSPAYLQPHRPVQTRLFATNNNKNDGGSFLTTLKNAAKSVLPSSWFQSEKEKKAALERKRVQDEVSGGLREMLKDAPLPIRMMGSMITPLMSSVMSGLAETMANQQEEVDSILRSAKSYLLADEAVGRLLGEPISVGAPFSQSSSSASINGETTTKVQLGFPVNGSRSSGVAQVSSTNGQVQQLQLQANGRVINVSLSSSKRPKKFVQSSDDNVLDAEIIEKDTKQ